MKYLILGNEKGFFTKLCDWINQHTVHTCAMHGVRWKETPIPFSDPDRLVILNNFIRREDYLTMGIMSNPERLFYLIQAPYGRGGLFRLDGRILEWNDHFFSQTELDRHFITQKKKCPISLEYMDEESTLPDLTFLPFPVDITEVPRKQLWDEDLTISAALSTGGLNSGVSKGCHILRQLKKETGIGLDIFNGLSRSDSLRRKTTSTIVWDNHHGNIGVSGLESMAQGIPVLGRFSPIVIENWTRLSGVDNVTFPVLTYNTFDELKNLILYYKDHKEELVTKGQECYDWMQNYATPEKIANYWVNIIEGKING